MFTKFNKMNLWPSSSNSSSGHGCGSRSICLVRFLTIVFLVLIKNVSHIDCGVGGVGGGGVGAEFHSVNPFKAMLMAEEKAHAATNALADKTHTLLLPDTHRVAKRMVDLESCLGQFDVHKNTIIRTGESQLMGGKFLQGLQLNTMEECQRLCCETDECDVYVFDEKNDGYCYLFVCGPPENFHCKFTRHSNYTSAVLTTVRHFNAEVTTQRPNVAHAGTAVPSISQQEWELSSLKVKAAEARDGNKAAADAVIMNGVATSMVGGNSGSSGNSATGVLPQTTQIQTQMAFPEKVSGSNAHCGRFQFACHSGECIAVYNACDGIPQCEDGSDEGPECLGANAAKSNADNSNVNIVDTNMQKSATVTQYQQPLLQQTPQQQLQTVQQQQQQQQQTQAAIITPPLINNREDAAAWANRKIVADNQQQQADIPNSVDLNSRIFNHKGGLQLPTNGFTSFPNANTNLNNQMYAAVPLQRNVLYMPQQAGTDMSNSGGAGGMQYAVPQQQQQQQQQPQLMTAPGHILLPPNLINWQSSQQQQQQSLATSLATNNGLQQPQQQQGNAYILNTPQQAQQQITDATKMKTNLSSPGVAAEQSATTLTAAAPVKPTVNILTASQAAVGGNSNSKVALKSTVLAEAAEETDEYDDYEEKSTEPPKKKQRKHKKLKSKQSNKQLVKTKDPIELALEEQKQHAVPPSPVHEQYKMIHENLALEFLDHDGQSERPGGAVLSLTLGLLVTAALAILIGCRMRTMGRRGRRLGSKTPFTGETDFLVNGMYL